MTIITYNVAKEINNRNSVFKSCGCIFFFFLCLSKPLWKLMVAVCLTWMSGRKECLKNVKKKTHNHTIHNKIWMFNNRFRIIQTFIYTTLANFMHTSVIQTLLKCHFYTKLFPTMVKPGNSRIATGIYVGSIEMDSVLQ
jgi:hypothetical protein